MKPKLLLSLALVLFIGLALQLPTRASVVDIHVLPANLSDLPISVKITDADFGKQFTVFYKTNETTSDEFFHARLEVSDEDNQITSSQVEKIWTTNGVKFEFTVSAAYVTASKFSIAEEGHVREMPMPGFTYYWFYLRDFATNNAPPVKREVNSNVVPPEIVKALPDRMQALRPGTRRDEVWKQLHLSAYRGKLGGVSYVERERFWLTWNYELELTFEEIRTNRPDFNEGNRKLIRATLYKNGLKISDSGK